MASPAPRVVKTVPINAGNSWNPSDWYTGNMTPPVPQPNGTLQQANWTDISNNPSTPLGAINAAVPGANGSIIPNKDVSQLAPSPGGLPALYGQPMPPVFGGSWANFADSMGSGWTGGGGYDAQGLPIDSNTPLNLPPGLPAPPPGLNNGGGGVPSVPPPLTMMQRNRTYRQLALNPISEATTGHRGVGGFDTRHPMRSAPIPGQRFR